MSNKTEHSRREFIEGIFLAGAAFAFTEIALGEENNPGTPLSTQIIPQPDNPTCSCVGFSPINDQVVFASGIIDRTSLYVSRVGNPTSFDLLWEPTATSCVIKGIAWSPNGQEIAFLAQEVNEQAIPKTAKISIYVVDIVSRAVREPVIIGESIGEEITHNANVSYKKGFSWRGNSFVCVPANDGSVIKYDSHTGQSETIIINQNSTVISKVALALTGELRYIKIIRNEQGNEYGYFIGGLSQDGVLHDYVNLSQQIGQILNARLSQNGDYVFVEKQDITSGRVIQIYKIEPFCLIGQIPSFLNFQNNIYAYVPLSVRNNNELILIELVSLDGSGFNVPPLIKAASFTLS